MDLNESLRLKRCPHCSVDMPYLRTHGAEFTTTEDNGANARKWRVYVCQRCGGIITASAAHGTTEVKEIYPKPEVVDELIPGKARVFLQQAIDSVFTPAGSVMLCASAVDAMLKERGYLEGKLYPRINKATENGLLTEEMAKWAHQVRLEANDQRHSDEDSPIPTVEEAKQCIKFTQTLAELLFILPAKVTRGIEDTKQSE